MPVKNTVKIYLPDSYYHVYNRGVEQRKIFLDNLDYQMFLYQLKYYLDTPNQNDIKQKHRSLNKEVILLAYCLMPNHFHLLLKQISTKGMTKLLRAVNTNYACYFNKRYKRVGGLFQGKYKAVLINQESYLLHLSRYIHLNPLKLYKPKTQNKFGFLRSFPYSSYKDYLGLTRINWLNINEILDYFHSSWKTSQRDILSYQSFVEKYYDDAEKTIGDLTLE